MAINNRKRLFPSIHTLFLLIFPLILLITLTITSSAHAQDATVAGYSPGARSATTANTMLDSVVGNSHSPIKTQTSATGEIYHIADDGTITAPNGLIVNPGGCQSPTGPRSDIKSKYRFEAGRRGKGFETVTIGVSDQPARNSSSNSPQKTRRATLNASFGPTGLYVLPEPCAPNHSSDHALTLDAASSLANADGNVFTLAGNRSAIVHVDTAIPLPDGDIQLTHASAKTIP